jgi:hypothetical protein
MESRTSPIMGFAFVEFSPENGRLLAASSIRPTEYFCRWTSFDIDADETVPKRASGDVSDLAFDAGRDFQNIIDRTDNLSERDFRVDFGSSIRSRGQRSLILHECLGQHVALRIVKGRAHAGRADVQTENEFLSQD